MTRSIRIVGIIAAAALAAFPAAVSFAQSDEQAPYTVVETGRVYPSLQQAIDAIGGGKGTIRFASLSFADCGVQTAGDVTYEAAVPGQAVLDGVACEDKAALVLRGRAAHIVGLTFADIRVPDKNGAGIRLESGDLTVEQSWFRDSQQGILTGDDPDGSVTIDKSTFTRLGTCEGSGCAHSVYVGNYGSTTVTRSRFEQGRGGHYLKSRAARIDVTDSSFDDSQGRATNYLIDLPDGATGSITGNWFVQGPDKENHSAMITCAVEHQDHPCQGLTVTGNNARLAPGVEWSTVFVADKSGQKLNISGNSLGQGIRAFQER